MKNICFLSLLAIAGIGSVTAQPYSPPCTIGLATEEEFAAWTVIDGNPSSTPYVWTFNSSASAAECNSNSEAADDWLVSPGIELQGGKAYTVSFSTKSSASYDYQTFDITAGTTTTIESQQAIKNITDFKSTFYSGQVAEFTPENNGTYHFAIHCKSKKWNGELSVNSLTVSAAPEYPAQVAALTATAGAAGALEATLTWTWPSTNGNGGELSQLSGAKIERKDDSSFYNDYQEIARIEENVVMGAAATFVDQSVTKAGPYSYRVTAYNNDGDAQGTRPTASVDWIGEDIPNPVTGLTATADGQNVIVDFTKPTAGKNGYYLDTDNLTFKIVRKSGSASVTLQEAYNGTLPYVDSSISEIGSYTYTVTVLSKSGNQSEAATSEAVTAGPAFTVPYTADLTKQAEAALFTFEDANNDNRTWKYNSSSNGISYWGGPEADDWAISPKVTLEAGKAYKITLSAKLKAYSGITESDYKNIAVALGRQPNAASMGNPSASVTVTSQYAADFEFPVNVGETGDWHVGIHAFDKSNTNDVCIMHLTVEEVPATPLEASEVKAVRADEGKLEVSVSWRNPTDDNTGAPLSSITKAELYRNGETLVHTIANAVPGATESFTDNSGITAGIHTYTVRCYLGDNHSEASTTTEWVGFDTPLPVANLKATADGTQVEITFDAPTATVNGGYLEAEGMGYLIQRNETVVAACYTGTLPYIDQVETLDAYVYSVAPVTRSGLTGESALSESVIAGDAMEIPYEADFTTDKDFSLMETLDANGDEKCWTYSSYDDAAQIYSKKTEEGDWLFTPKLKISNHYRYKVTVGAELYRAWAETSYTTVNVYIGQGLTPESQQLMGTFSVESAMTENHSFEVELSESGNYRVGIQAMGNDDVQTLYLKSIKVENAGISSVGSLDNSQLRYDRAADRVTAPSEGRIIVTGATGITLADTVGNTADTSALPHGVYIATSIGNDGETIQMKFIK